jgi:anti-repressor protein
MKPALFTHADFGALRVVEIQGDPWFSAGDLCLMLGISNASDAVSSLGEFEKGVATTDTLGGPQQIRVVSESGMYALIFRSRKPEAQRFRQWVTSEVLPTIRKTGTFTLDIPKTLPEALRLAADLAEKNEALALENAELRPKADFHDAVTASDDVTQLGIACQVLDLPFGRNTLFQRLRNRGVLISGGDRHNLPKQRFVEQGLFTVKESSYLDEDRQVHVRFTTYVTQKGIQWLRREFQLERSLA